MRRLTAVLVSALAMFAAGSFTPVAAASTVVRHVILTSRWTVPSPDPTGLDLLLGGQLLVADSEVDETRLNTGLNLWHTSRRGVVQRAMSTFAFSHEPTDIASGPTNDRWYISDDGQARIFIIWRGADRTYGTADDSRRWFSTTLFRTPSHDPEGLAFGGNRLWMTDGTNNRLYRLDPGLNGRIDGPKSDDRIREFDLSGLSIRNVEAVEFAYGRLFVLANEAGADILELDPIDASLIGVFDLSAAGLSHPSALAYGPSSLDSSKMSFYVADRGVDNNSDPNENDGKVVELSDGGG